MSSAKNLFDESTMRPHSSQVPQEIDDYSECNKSKMVDSIRSCIEAAYMQSSLSPTSAMVEHLKACLVIEDGVAPILEYDLPDSNETRLVSNPI